MSWRSGGLLAAIVVGIVATFAQPADPEVPKEIAVPAGHKLLFKVEAKGVQIYKAVEGKSGKLEWVLEAPLADLLDGKGGKAGWHYEGPSWEAADGSKVVRDKAEAVKSAPAPNPKSDIPWLLLKVKAEEGKAGVFSPALYIQRLQTAGGKAPGRLAQTSRDETRSDLQRRVLFLRQSPVREPPNRRCGKRASVLPIAKSATQEDFLPPNVGECRTMASPRISFRQTHRLAT